MSIATTLVRDHPYVERWCLGIKVPETGSIELKGKGVSL